MSLRSALPAIVVALLIALFYGGLKLDPRVIDSPFIGKPAPQFDMEDLFDPSTRVASSGWAGRPFVLNVWGTWCPECYREHDTLLRIKAEGKIPLIGLNWRDERARAQQYLQQSGNPFARVGFDPDGRNAIDWGVYGAPETFLISASGEVLHKHTGALDWRTWQREFVARVDATGASQGGQP